MRQGVEMNRVTRKSLSTWEVFDLESEGEVTEYDEQGQGKHLNSEHQQELNLEMLLQQKSDQHGKA